MFEAVSAIVVFVACFVIVFLVSLLFPSKRKGFRKKPNSNNSSSYSDYSDYSDYSSHSGGSGGGCSDD